MTQLDTDLDDTELDDTEVDDLDLDDESEGGPDADAPKAPTPRWVNWLLAVSLILAIVGPAVAAWMYFAQFRPDQEIDPQIEQQVLTAAADGTVAVLTYTPQTLDADFAKAESHLTGEFLTYYDGFTTQMVAPAATEAGSTSSASVTRKAIVEMAPDSATVLLFVNQSASNTENPEPGLSSSVVRVGLTKVDGVWLISALTPV